MASRRPPRAPDSVFVRMKIDPKKISIKEISSVFRSARAQGLLSAGNHPSAIFFNVSKIRDRIEDIQNAFPQNAFHAIALKTNPLNRLLVYLHQFNVGLEAASFTEVQLAMKAGFSPGSIVFNGPAKTEEELRQAMQWGVYINCDNFTEIDRVARLQKQGTSRSAFGLRVNPQIGVGTIPASSTAGKYSKFGVPLSPCRKQIHACFERHPWLKGLHVHSGSQGLEIPQLVHGIERVYGLAEEINYESSQKSLPRLVNTMDIGGGFPLSYHTDIPSPEMQEYAADLRKTCPKLFDEYKIITEFGRFVYGHSGWVASRIEYIKRQGRFSTAIIHVGADLFLRESYDPQNWHHDLSVLDREGNPKIQGRKQRYQIGGPLCFEGDTLKKDVLLPVLEEGDYLVVQDAGANTINLWSRYCSRLIPKILGYSDSPREFLVLKEKESLEDLLRFWG